MAKKRDIKISEKSDSKEKLIIEDNVDSQSRESIIIDNASAPTSFIKKHWLKLLPLLLLPIIFIVLFSKGNESGSSKTPIISRIEKSDVIIQNQTLRNFLLKIGVDPTIVPPIVSKATEKGLLEVERGKPYQLFYEKAIPENLLEIRYEPNDYFYYAIDLQEEKFVNIIERPKYQGFEQQSWVLKEDMMDVMTLEAPKTKLPWEILGKLEDILSWSIGLRNLSKDDKVNIVWEYTGIEGKPLIKDNMKIVALSLEVKTLDTTLYAFSFTQNEVSAFYDEDGRSWKRRFLRSPVKYARISSRYNLSRFHPVFKEVRAHKGNDFAAPEGSEILALANGKISARSFTKGNGNFIRIDHDSIYRTAYLHLSKFEESVQLGDSVKQGQVIGYVGATGAATGPHVCLRFWRRAFQDDFVGAFLYLPKPPALPEPALTAFFKQRNALKTLLNQ